MILSKNLKLNEVTKSQTAIRKGIDNDPTPEHLENLKLVAENIFQKIRDHFEVPIGVSSGYRSEELNSAIGGSSTSQHCKGQALDLDADIYGKIDNFQLFDYIVENLDYDQIIMEFIQNDKPAWIHVSYKSEGNRKSKLIAYKDAKGKTRYSKYSEELREKLY